MMWAEFGGYNTVTEGWVAGGNIAIVPYLISRIGRGESRYMIARDRATFVAACHELDTVPSDLPRERSSINVDGALLLRALAKCRWSALGPTHTATAQRLAFPAGLEPWTSKCPTCGLPFHLVASHTVGSVLSMTIAACAAGHRWPV